MNITVYLSSKTDVSPSYTEAVKELARGIGEMGDRLVYGGSNAGQMHVLAEEAKAAGATVTGVIPEVFRAISDPVVDQMIYTLDLSERKAKLYTLGNVFVALPGGIGTLDEIMSVLAEMTVSKNYNKTIFLVNIDGLYNPFLQQLEEFVKQNLADRTAVNCVVAVNTAKECIDKIKELKL